MSEMGIADVLIIGLAAWRVSVFVTSGAGPWDVMANVRELFGVVHDVDGDIESRPVAGLGKLITCVWCFSFWAVAFLGAIYTFMPYAVLGMAAWGVVGIIQGLVFRGD